MNRSTLLSIVVLCTVAACGGGGKSTNHQSTIGQPVPASTTPSKATPAPSASQLPPALGVPATAAPSQMSAMPASVQPPTSNTTVINISTTIINHASSAADTGSDCDSFGLDEGTGYCDDDEPGYVTLCIDGEVWAFDCGSYGSAYQCGYLFAGDGEIACVDAPDQFISESVAGDSEFAYETAIPCTEADEGYAECHGSVAYYCHDGWVRAEDCALYSIEGAAADCGLDDAGDVDCGVAGE